MRVFRKNECLLGYCEILEICLGLHKIELLGGFCLRSRYRFGTYFGGLLSLFFIFIIFFFGGGGVCLMLLICFGDSICWVQIDNKNRVSPWGMAID